MLCYQSKTIEILYFLLQNSLLDCNFNQANIYLGLLKQAYKEDKDLFKKSLTDKQKKKLKLFEKQTLQKEIIYQPFPFNKFEKISPVGERVEEEIELQNQFLRKKFFNLPTLLNFKDYKLSGIEIPVDEGFVDVIIDNIVNNQTIRYLIELKAGIADHRVIGQIMKYKIYFTKKLLYKLWDDVEGIVIAHGFTENALIELKKLNIITIRYIKTNEKFEYELV